MLISSCSDTEDQMTLAEVEKKAAKYAEKLQLWAGIQKRKLEESKGNSVNYLL